MPCCRDNSFQGVPIDSSRVGISGHSLGGYTALGLAGAWPSWKDLRIKAVLALSPHCSPFLLKGDLGHMDIPVMYQGGTIDLGETPVVKRAGGVYDRSSKPKYLCRSRWRRAFRLDRSQHPLSERDRRVCVAFFDRYLKGHKAPDPLAPMMRESTARKSARRTS